MGNVRGPEAIVTLTGGAEREELVVRIDTVRDVAGLRIEFVGERCLETLD